MDYNDVKSKNRLEISLVKKYTKGMGLINSIREADIRILNKVFIG